MGMENMWNIKVFYSKNFCLSPTGNDMLTGELNALYDNSQSIQLDHVIGFI
jgi:hypothetical protein